MVLLSGPRRSTRDDGGSAADPGPVGRPPARVSLTPTRRASLIAAVVAVPLIPLALSGSPAGDPPAAVPVEGVSTPGTVPVASKAQVVPPNGRAAKPVAPPARLIVPAIGLDERAPEPLGLDTGGRLGAPVDYDRIGWYAQGPKPGEAGPAVIVGHVDSVRGPAVFFRLRDLQAGDTVTVQRTDGWKTTFTVDAVRAYPKDAFPSDEVYGQTANAQLRLITCGGAFDRSVRSYEDNVVVFASVH